MCKSDARIPSRAAGAHTGSLDSPPGACVCSSLMGKTSSLMCLSALVVCGVLYGQERSSSTQNPSREATFARLRSKIDVERVGDLATHEVSGKYTSSPDELRGRVLPLSGDDLYLFPDGSYIYLFWSDIPPATILDKGHWIASDGEVRLTSDSDVTWNPGVERRYLLVRRHSRPKEILAIGVDQDIPNFEKNADRDPDFQLLLRSKMQVSRISPNESVQLKEKLMHDAWRPDFYGPEKLSRPKK